MDLTYSIQLTQTRPFFHQPTCVKSLYPLNINVKKTIYSNKKWFNKKPILAAQKKHCAFLHGSGVAGDPKVADKFEKDYWGNVRDYTQDFCSNHSFSFSDTRNRGWNNTHLQKEYCEVLTRDQEDKFTIKNKIIISHSLGNLILAAAINNNFCNVDTATTTWYDSCGPLKGTPVAIFLIKVCDSVIPEIVKSDICDGNRPLVAYESLYPGTPGLKEVEETAHKYIKGNMCGHSPYGITTSYSLGLSLVASIVGLEKLNDGLVPYSSCVNEKKDYDKDPESLFYGASINHADGTCRNADGWFGSDRKPCYWYGLRD